MDILSRQFDLIVHKLIRCKNKYLFLFHCMRILSTFKNNNRITKTYDCHQYGYMNTDSYKK